MNINTPASGNKAEYNLPTEDYNKYTAYYEEVPNDDFYEALAWRGLKEQNVNAWTELSTERKEEIYNLSIRVDILTKEVNCTDQQHKYYEKNNFA